MADKYTVHWGILATGAIATRFAKDLLVDPATRGVHDIEHIVQAAASSSSLERAKEFLRDVGAPSSSSAYGSYEELVQDPQVDVIYVATPHSHHFDNCLLALGAGKHVVCEKPFTVNAAQTKILIDMAGEKRLFLMEAVWTRFFPLSVEVRDMVKSGKLGEVKRVHAELNIASNPTVAYADGKHRMVNANLAGGALLDIGIYPLTWVFQTLYHVLPEEQRKAPSVFGAIQMYEPTGVDADNVVVCKFEKSIGVASSSIYVATDPDSTNRTGIRIMGTKAEVQVSHPAYQPKSIRIIPVEKHGKVVEKKFPIPGGGSGMFWEADGAARALRDGKLESETIPLSESLMIMEVMDQVRRDNNFKYPESIERTNH